MGRVTVEDQVVACGCGCGCDGMIQHKVDERRSARQTTLVVGGAETVRSARKVGGS